MGAPDTQAFALPWTAGKDQIAALRGALRKGLSPLTVEPPIKPADWAKKYFYLSAEASHGQQRWNPYAYQGPILNVFGNEDIEQIAFIKSARVGYTKMLDIKVAWTAEHKRRNQAIWQPTDEDRDSYVKTEIDSMIRDVEVLRKIAASPTGKSKTNTLNQKQFVGSILHLLGAKSAKNFRRITISDAHIDELDGCDREVEKTSSPRALAWKRTEGAAFRKLIAGSTPLLKGLSLIEDFHDECIAQVRWQIECPACGLDHPLIWGGKDVAHGIKWDPLDPHDASKVRHHCPHCNHAISQAEYKALSYDGALVSRCGNWRSRDGWEWTNGEGESVRPPRTLGIHLWTAYSEQVAWVDIVDEFLKAHAKVKEGDKSALKGFVNETLGETWEDDDADKLNQHELSKRAEPYALYTIPTGGLALTCYADTQDGWWALQWVAHGRNNEKWIVGYDVLHGDPSVEEDWERLHNLMQRPLRHESGALVRPDACGIDTQGHHAHSMYMFIRKYSAAFRYYGTKGESTYGRPIKSRSTIVEINHKGKTIKRGTKLWLIGTDTAKDLIYGQLQLPKPKTEGPAPGYIHFSHQLEDTYYNEITNEIRITIKGGRGGDQSRWVPKKSHLRVEGLDTLVGNFFLFNVLDLHRNTDAMWDKREQALQPDLFGQPNASAAEGDNAAAPAAAAATHGGAQDAALLALMGGNYQTSKPNL